jgi:hypothetical protein
MDRMVLILLENLVERKIRSDLLHETVTMWTLTVFSVLKLLGVTRTVSLNANFAYGNSNG